jgi:hypothetical protein
MQRVWEEEKDASLGRQQVRWSEVLSKQSKVRILRSELQGLESRLARGQKILKGYLQPSSRTTQQNDFEYRECSEEISLAKQLISRKEDEIKLAEKPPPPLFQPLPFHQNTALPVIFFLLMPIEFRVYSRLCFMAQQMLLPKSNTVKLASIGDIEAKTIKLQLRTDEPETEWQSYYCNAHGKESLTPTKVIIGSLFGVPGTVGPSNVMSYTSPSDGVWHPDSLVPGMWWNGGGFSPDSREDYMLPFAKIEIQATVHYFTETLPKDFNCMQWAMPVYGNCIPADRSNYALANQDTRPKWLTTPEFLTFGALRAYPNQQMRKLCIVLSNRSLPFDHVNFVCSHEFVLVWYYVCSLCTL